MLEDYLNKIVDVKIDRPLNSVHPKHSNIVYSVNYGYIPNTTSGDNEEIDAYILRVNKPLDKFKGKVVAIIKRLDDVENKLIVMPEDNCEFVTEKEILKATNFQEKYFKIEVLLSENN